MDGLQFGVFGVATDSGKRRSEADHDGVGNIRLSCVRSGYDLLDFDEHSHYYPKSWIITGSPEISWC